MSHINIPCVVFFSFSLTLTLHNVVCKSETLRDTGCPLPSFLCVCVCVCVGGGGGG